MPTFAGFSENPAAVFSSWCQRPAISFESHHASSPPALRLRGPKEKAPEPEIAAGTVLASWSERKGPAGRNGTKPAEVLPAITKRLGHDMELFAVLDAYLTPMSGQLSRILSGCGLRNPAIRVTASRWRRTDRETALDIVADVQPGDTVSQLLQATVEHLARQYGTSAGINVEVRLEGQLHHPPAPHPKRQKLGHRR